LSNHKNLLGMDASQRCSLSRIWSLDWMHGHYIWNELLLVHLDWNPWRTYCLKTSWTTIGWKDFKLYKLESHLLDVRNLIFRRTTTCYHSHLLSHFHKKKQNKTRQNKTKRDMSLNINLSLWRWWSSMRLGGHYNAKGANETWNMRVNTKF
jgi:hypothetical protein